MGRWKVAVRSAVLLGAALCPIRAAEGQDLHGITGTVEDRRGRGLAAVRVRVLSTEWGVVAGPRGRFALRLPPGEWRLELARIGYRSDTVRVRVPRGDARPVRVTLVEQPLALRGITVEAPTTLPLGQTVTTETVRQVPPLGEPDVFRALTLLPHVTQPNDLKGRIHLAGGASDETGIRLDGHRLQDPFHLLGLLGSFNVAALERAEVLTHHLPAAEGGRLSGSLDLRSRSPREAGEGEVVGSLLAGGVTVNQPLPAGLDLLAAGRASWLGGVIRVVDPTSPEYDFRDGLVRLGWSGGDWRAEALAFGTGDRFESAPQDRRLITWGERLVGIRLERAGTLWSLQARASFDRSRLDFDFGARPDSGGFAALPAPTGPPMMHSTRDWAAAAFEVARVWETVRLGLGVEADVRENAQRWRARELAPEILTPSTPPLFARRSRQTVVSPFAEVGTGLGGGWSAVLGVRVPVHDGLATVAPRALLRREWGAARVSLAAGRRVQFDAQAEEPIEGSITAPLFLLDRPRRADVVAAVVEWRGLELGELGRASARVEAFAKRYPDRPLLQPRDSAASPDQAWAGFPEFERVDGRAFGASLGGVAELGPVLVQGSYSYQRAEQEHRPGEWSPTAWDAPHALDVLGSVQLGDAWVANGVLRAHSGRAVTPVLARIFEPAGANQLASRYLLGDRNSARVPAYLRLDLGLRYRGEWSRFHWALSAQVLNVLGRANPVDYDWPQYFARLHDGRDPGGHRPGLPLLPSLGLEVRW